jgi:hypothetical protein
VPLLPLPLLTRALGDAPPVADVAADVALRGESLVGLIVLLVLVAVLAAAVLAVVVGLLLVLLLLVLVLLVLVSAAAAR